MLINHISQSSGKTYQINLEKMSCNCPDYRNRQAKIKGLCKHLRFEIEKITGNCLDYTKVLEEDNDALKFVERFGEEVLEMLKRKGICYEQNGELILL
jgi:hypothetical protein